MSEMSSELKLGGVDFLGARLHPGRIFFGNIFKYRTIFLMGSLEVANAYQKIANNLTAGEFKSFLEKLAPLIFGERMMCCQPLGKADMRFSNFLNRFGIINRRFNFKAIADD